MAARPTDVADTAVAARSAELQKQLEGILLESARSAAAQCVAACMQVIEDERAALKAEQTAEISAARELFSQKLAARPLTPQRERPRAEPDKLDGFVYLPTDYCGAQVLFKQSEDTWQALPDEIRKPSGISYRATKSLDSSTITSVRGPAWGESFRGYDDGDGWVRVPWPLQEPLPTT